MPLKKKTNAGFTLIELLVVLFIIGILTGLLLSNFVGARQRARDAKRKEDLGEIKNALRLYYNDHQQYPDTISFGERFASDSSVYMEKVPQDPLGDSHSYGYCVSFDGEGFRIWADLENGGDPEITSSQVYCPALTGESCTSSCDPETQNCYYVCSH